MESPPSGTLTRFSDIKDDEWFLDAYGDLHVRVRCGGPDCVYFTAGGTVGTTVSILPDDVVTPVDVVIEWRKPT